MNHKRHLFICGCPRSGTTALWSLISSHKHCVIGVERYGNRFFHQDFISPCHFYKDRFFQIERGDTFYDNLEAFNPYYDTAQQRFDECVLVGDKIPLLFNYFGSLQHSFPDATVLMIFRNIFDVAASYAVRASDESDKTWSPMKGVASAISDWSASIAAYRNWQERINIVAIDYENLFVEGSGATKIFASLGLDETPETISKYSQLLVRSAALETTRSKVVSSMEAKLISTSAPFGCYREVLSASL